MAMLIVGIVTFITPVNVFAMPNADDGIMTLGYGQHDNTTVGFTKSISVTILPNVTFNVGVNGEIFLNYEWDEGYDSRFTSGSGYASVFSVLDGIAQDGWTAEVRHITTTGRTILFKIVVFRNGKEVGSSDISYYVDEYGQVF